MIITSKITKGDRVKVIKTYEEYEGESCEGDEILLGSTGTVIAVDEKWEFPYQIKFDDAEAEKYSDKRGTLLFKREQLEFYFEEAKPALTKEDLLFLANTLENNINALTTEKREIEERIDSVVYSLSTLQTRIIRIIKEMD